MTQMQKELVKEHAHELPQDKLELGMHYLSRVFKHLSEMHDTDELKEIQAILNIDMDEVFARRISHV